MRFAKTALFLTAFGLLLAGCFLIQPTKYVCPDGSEVSDKADCPLQVTVTPTQQIQATPSTTPGATPSPTPSVKATPKTSVKPTATPTATPASQCLFTGTACCKTTCDQAKFGCSAGYEMRYLGCTPDCVLMTQCVPQTTPTPSSSPTATPTPTPTPTPSPETITPSPSPSIQIGFPTPTPSPVQTP